MQIISLCTLNFNLSRNWSKDGMKQNEMDKWDGLFVETIQ